MPSVGEDLALRSLCNHSIIGVSLYLMELLFFKLVINTEMFNLVRALLVSGVLCLLEMEM